MLNIILSTQFSYNRMVVFFCLFLQQFVPLISLCYMLPPYEAQHHLHPLNFLISIFEKRNMISHCIFDFRFSIATQQIMLKTYF